MPTLSSGGGCKSDEPRKAYMPPPCAAAPCSAFACCRPSFPTLDAPRLLNPFEHLWSLRLLQGLHLDVAASVGGSERRRLLEFRAAEEDDIHGHVVGD